MELLYIASLVAATGFLVWGRSKAVTAKDEDQAPGAFWVPMVTMIVLTCKETIEEVRRATIPSGDQWVMTAKVTHAIVARSSIILPFITHARTHTRTYTPAGP